MANNTYDHEGGSGEYCLMCGRSEKEAGKMVYLPGGLRLCSECMQKAVDQASKIDFQSIFNNPLFMQNNPFFPGGAAARGHRTQTRRLWIRPRIRSPLRRHRTKRL